MSETWWWVSVAAAALLLIGGSAEVAARRWLRSHSAYYVWPPGLRLRVHPDPAIFPELEAVVHFNVNTDGERGDEVPRRKGDLYRILVVGGSAVEGYLLDQPTSWPGALQRLLNAPQALRTLKASRVHVGNIGRSGVGSQALALILERVLPRYPRLDAIVVMVGATDVFQWLERGARSSLWH